MIDSPPAGASGVDSHAFAGGGVMKARCSNMASWGAANLVALALGGAAWADPPERELRASPGVFALELIAEANAEGVFEAAPSEHDVVVRHIQSGLVCWMPEDNTNALTIFPQSVRGEDVACDSHSESEFQTLYATRYPRPAGLDEVFEGAIGALLHRFPDGAPYKPGAIKGAPALGPAPRGSRTARFVIVGEDGLRRYTRVSLAVIDGWVLKLRYTRIAEDDFALIAAEETAEISWIAALDQFMQAHST
jgi:hypothetical protein